MSDPNDSILSPEEQDHILQQAQDYYLSLFRSYILCGQHLARTTPLNLHNTEGRLGMAYFPIYIYNYWERDPRDAKVCVDLVIHEDLSLEFEFQNFDPAHLSFETMREGRTLRVTIKKT